jgi:hypothetical protein
VEVDADQRRLFAHERLAAVAALDLHRVGIDHVLPAVILEVLFPGHAVTPFVVVSEP